MSRDDDRRIEDLLRAGLGYDPFRPRDEYDVDIHPESLRGKALRFMDEAAEAERLIRAAIDAAPWYRRWPIRVYLRLRRIDL